MKLAVASKGSKKSVNSPFNKLKFVHLGMEGVGQTILTPAAKKQGQHHQQMETIVLQASDRLPSIIQVH